VSVSPTNAPLTIASGDWRAEIVPERGGRMARLTFRGAEVLEPITDWNPPGRAWPGAGLYPLVPYSNRIANARLRIADRAVRLRVHPFAAPHAVHGPGHRRPWTVEAAGRDGATLRLDYEADEDWPWAFESVLSFALEDDALATAITLRNRAAEPMPAGLGLHPFFHAPDGTRYAFSYRDRWQQLETDPPAPRFGDDPIEVRDTVTREGLAACLGRWGGEGIISRPDLTIRVSSSANLTHLVVYRAAASAFLCLEPVSHATDGFNLHAEGQPHTGATFLAPGETLAAAMTIACTPPATTA
jgi:aldose 1-epimerase